MTRPISARIHPAASTYRPMQTFHPGPQRAPENVLPWFAMKVDVQRKKGTVTVGPPQGPQRQIPAAFTITITDHEPYDLRLDVAWSPTMGRHTLRQLTITAQDGDEYVRMSQLNQIAFAKIVETALHDHVIGPDGWQQILDDHADHDPVAVDALIYLLSHALGGQRPAATIAIARGLSPATGPKRAAHARQAGLIPPADEPGKASG